MVEAKAEIVKREHLRLSDEKSQVAPKRQKPAPSASARQHHDITALSLQCGAMTSAFRYVIDPSVASDVRGRQQFRDCID